METQNEGLSVHLHHNCLIEYCTDYDERLAYIKSNKPKNEQGIRLKFFKLLSAKAIRELPKKLVKAKTDWINAEADCVKAEADCVKAEADWKGKEKWHKKFCGCKEWNGKELVFR